MGQVFSSLAPRRQSRRGCFGPFIWGHVFLRGQHCSQLRPALPLVPTGRTGLRCLAWAPRSATVQSYCYLDPVPKKKKSHDMLASLIPTLHCRKQVKKQKAGKESHSLFIAPVVCIQEEKKPRWIQIVRLGSLKCYPVSECYPG